jgi:hypothetical protein
MFGPGRRIILCAITPRPTPRTVYTLYTYTKNKETDAKADHVSSSTAKAKKEHVELYF